MPNSRLCHLLGHNVWHACWRKLLFELLHGDGGGFANDGGEFRVTFPCCLLPCFAKWQSTLTLLLRVGMRSSNVDKHDHRVMVVVSTQECRTLLYC
jgi:hypothetical protein